MEKEKHNQLLPFGEDSNHNLPNTSVKRSLNKGLFDNPIQQLEINVFSKSKLNLFYNYFSYHKSLSTS